jgi:hypothetical protein
MSYSPLATADTVSRSADGRLHVAVGLAGGALLRGRLGMRGAGRVVDFLNNNVEPFVTLAPTVAAGGAASHSTVVVVRQAMVWVAALEPEPVRWQPAHAGTIGASGALPRAHPVIVHAGPFEVRGVAHVYPGANWQDYLMANRGPSAYLPLAEARVAGPTGSFEAPVVAVSASRIDALLGLG